MPELPEIQALAERLEELLAGARLAGQPLQFSGLKTVGPRADTLSGQKLARSAAGASISSSPLERARMLVHLSQGGRVDIEGQPKTTRPKGVGRALRSRRRPCW